MGEDKNGLLTNHIKKNDVISNNEQAASDHEESLSPSSSSSKEEDPTIMYIKVRAWHTSDDLYYMSGAALIGMVEIATAVTNNNADNGLEAEVVAFMLPSVHMVDDPANDVSPEDYAMAHVLVLSTSSPSLPEKTEKEGKGPPPYLHDLTRTRDWPGALQ
eukprot:scaffold141826_cov35-Attheya_sp.AAC.3